MENQLESVQVSAEKSFGIELREVDEKIETHNGLPKKEDEVIYVEDMDKDLQAHPAMFEMAKGLNVLEKEFYDRLGEFAKQFGGIEVSARVIFRLKQED